LGDLALTDRVFDPQPVFNPREDRYKGNTLFAVEMAYDRTNIAQSPPRSRGFRLSHDRCAKAGFPLSRE